MNLLQIVQEFCTRTGLPRPVAIATSQDDQNLQYMGLLNEVLDDLSERKAWSALQMEATFTSLATEDQGALSTLAPFGFVRLQDDLLFNRTSNEVILGPVSPETWQAQKAGMATVSALSYRIKGGHLFLTPAPAAGQTIAFEYKGDYAVVDNTTTPISGKAYFTRDSDTCLYPDKLLIQGLRWVWKREKGLRYAEEFRKFEAAVANFAGSDGGHAPVNLADGSLPSTGLSVNDRSWPL